MIHVLKMDIRVVTLSKSTGSYNLTNSEEQ